jgi:hypothetical protein
MNHSVPHWLVPPLIAACGFAGYAMGSVGNPTKKGTGGGREISPAERKLSREARELENPVADFKNLLVRKGRDADLWKIVSRLPAASVSEALQALREARAVTSSGTAAAMRLDEFESALYYHWAEFDPVAALADVSAMPGPPNQDAIQIRKALLESVLAAWMRTDPNAAYRAVKDHEDFGYVGRDMLVQTWTAENVFENLKQFPDKNRDLFGHYCYYAAGAGNEEKRDAALKALKEKPDLKDRDWGYFLLFRQWAYTDFPAAMAEAKKHDHPGLEKHVFTDGLNQQPAATMRWAVSQNIPPGGETWESGYNNWLSTDPADAGKWLDEQAPAWIRDGHISAVAGFRAVQVSTAWLGRAGQDTDAAAKKLEGVMEEWRAKDPQAAAKWLDTAPEAARKLLTPGKSPK